MQITDAIRSIQETIEEETARGYNTKLLYKALRHYKKALKYATNYNVLKCTKSIERAEDYLNRYKHGECY